MKQHPVKPSQEIQRPNEQAVGVGSPPEHAQPVAVMQRGKPNGILWYSALEAISLPDGTQLYAAPPEHADLLGEAREALYWLCKSDIVQTELPLHCKNARAALARIDTVLNREPQQ